MADKNTKQSKLPEPTDSEILLSTIKVNKYNVEPWGLVEISLVAPLLMVIIRKAKANGIKLTTENSISEIPKLLPEIIDEMLEIIAITVGSTREEIKNIQPRSDTLALMLVIIQQNVNYLKNLPGLLSVIKNTITD